MGYDRIFFCPSSDPKSWFDLTSYEACEGYSEESEQEYRRLTKQGNWVVVAAGKGLMIDELFLFEQAADAQAFYENGYREREWWMGREEEGCGFDHVELYLEGRFVARKIQLPPSRRARNQTLPAATSCRSSGPR